MPHEVHERLAILETRSNTLEVSLRDLTTAVKTANESVVNLTARLDKAQNMLLGAGVVFASIGGFIMWVITYISKFFISTTH